MSTGENHATHPPYCKPKLMPRAVRCDVDDRPLSQAQDFTVDLMEPPCPITTVTMHKYCLSGSFLVRALYDVNCPTLSHDGGRQCANSMTVFAL